MVFLFWPPVFESNQIGSAMGFHLGACHFEKEVPLEPHWFSWSGLLHLKETQAKLQRVPPSCQQTEAQGGGGGDTTRVAVAIEESEKAEAKQAPI